MIPITPAMKNALRKLCTEEQLNMILADPEPYQEKLRIISESLEESFDTDDEYDYEEYDDLSDEEAPFSEDAECTHYGIGIRSLPGNKFQFVSFDKKSRQPRWGNETHDLKSKICECMIRKYFSRFLYPLLKPNERIVLEFIVDRTYGWGKSQERIRKTHFTKGIPNVTGGIGLSEPTINKALKRLCDYGILQTRDTYNGTVYKVSIESINQALISMNMGIKRYRPKKKSTPN